VIDLNRRALAMLRAVSEGRAEITCSCEPDLFIDGLCVCDQFTAHQITHALIRPAMPAAVGVRVHAELTVAGIAALGEA
jgi:hypothetical protein